jgi:dipeptidyl aminopeptidase/acylaminoacyl peptidase
MYRWLWTVAILPSLAPVARAELPPLIPRAVLFGNPTRTAPALSPDGKLLAWLAPSDKGVSNVWVQTLGKDDARMVTADRRRGIYAFTWAAGARHILFQQDGDGDENWHLFSTALDGGVVRDLTPFQGVRVQNVLTSRKRPGEVLVGLHRRDRRAFDMYRIDLETGAVKLDTKNPGDVLSWATDADFVIRAATAFDSECRTIIRVRDGQEAAWRDLLTSPFADSPQYGQMAGGTLVVGFTADGKGLYAVSPLGADTTRLVLLDAKTGKESEELAADSRSDVEYLVGAGLAVAPAVLTDPATGKPQAAALNRERVEWRAIDPAVADDLKALQKARPGDFFVAGRDAKDKRWLVQYDADDASAAHCWYDRDDKSVHLLFEDQPELKKYTLAKKTPVTIRTRDGLDLVCYLTLPPGVKAKDLPLVLFPHGGPWYRDRWGYDPVSQLLANRGYAVLQVNFRCSAGFGKKFLNTGNGQFGDGAVLGDLGDALRWAIESNRIDPKKVGIMGGSFGGYATLSEIAFHPDRYACAVDLVGPSNLKTLFSSMPAYWKPFKKRWVLRMGDVENDEALNRRLSPLFHADRIRAPLLIGHGVHDPRVALAESEAIVKALRDRKRPVEFVVYPDEGHGWSRPENNLDFFGRVEVFLAKHLGGRAEPWAKVPGASAELR